eukprot:TRINITY_DN2007_c0_g1_i4.p1 TRINITY_DN2007_c0_g1~~TRINITY_DN2007_c0_g1_i4.p1  ORF type:complete len:2197 (+),score=378.83 TRINITY_DN2007_c0_g1_i4:183-6773(+)
MMASRSYTSFQPSGSSMAVTASAEVNSDDESEEVQLRDAIMQMLPGSDDTTTTDSLLKGVIRTAFRQEWERLGKQVGDSTAPITTGVSACRDIVTDCLVSLDANLSRLLPKGMRAEQSDNTTPDTINPTISVTARAEPEDPAHVFHSTEVSKAKDDGEEEYLTTSEETRAAETADMYLVAQCAVQLTTAKRSGHHQDHNTLNKMCQALMRLVKGVFKTACDCKLLDVEVAEHGNQYALLQCLARLRAPKDAPLHQAAQRILEGTSSCDVFSMLISDATVPLGSGVQPTPAQLRSLHDTVQQVTLLAAETKTAAYAKVGSSSRVPRVIVVNCRSSSTCANAAYTTHLTGEQGSCISLLPGDRGNNVIEVVSPSEFVGRLLDGVQAFPCDSTARVSANPMYNVAAVVFEGMDVDAMNSLDMAVLQLCKAYLIYWRAVGVAHASMLAANTHIVPRHDLPATSMSYFDVEQSSAMLPVFQVVATTQSYQTHSAIANLFKDDSNASDLPPTIVATVPPLKVALLRRLFDEGPVSNELQQVLALDAAKGWADASMDPKGPLLANPVDTNAIRKFALVAHKVSVGTPAPHSVTAEPTAGCSIPVTRQVSNADAEENVDEERQLQFATLDVAVSQLRLSAAASGVATNDRLKALQDAEFERSGLMVTTGNLDVVTARRTEWVYQYVSSIQSSDVGSIVVAVAASEDTANAMATALQGHDVHAHTLTGASLDSILSQTQAAKKPAPKRGKTAKKASEKDGHDITVLCLSAEELVQLPLLLSCCTTPINIVAAIDAISVIDEGYHVSMEMYAACAPWAPHGTLISMNVTDAQLTSVATHQVDVIPSTIMAQNEVVTTHIDAVTCIGKSIEQYVHTHIEAQLFAGVHRSMFRHFHRRSNDLFQRFVVPKLSPLVAASQAYTAALNFVRSTPPTPVTDRAAVTLCGLVLPSIDKGLRTSTPSHISHVSDLDSATFAAILAGRASTPAKWLMNVRKTLTVSQAQQQSVCTPTSFTSFASLSPLSTTASGVTHILSNVVVPSQDASVTLIAHSVLLDICGSMRWSTAAVSALVQSIRKGPLAVSDDATSLANINVDRELLVAAASLHDSKPVVAAVRPRGFMRSLLSCDVYRASGVVHNDRENATEVWRESTAALAAAIPRRGGGRQLKGEPRTEADYRKQLQLASREAGGNVPQQTQLISWVKDAIAHSYPQKCFFPISHCLKQLLKASGKSDSSEVVSALSSALGGNDEGAVARTKIMEAEARRVVEYVSRSGIGATPILRGIASAMSFIERTMCGENAVATWMWDVETSPSSLYDFYTAGKSTAMTTSHPVELRPWNPLDLEAFYQNSVGGSETVSLVANGQAVNTNRRTVSVLRAGIAVRNIGLVSFSTLSSLRSQGSVRADRCALLSRMSTEHGAQGRWLHDAYLGDTCKGYPHNENGGGTACPSPLASDSGMGSFLLLGPDGVVAQHQLHANLHLYTNALPADKAKIATKLLNDFVHLADLVRRASSQLSAAMVTAAVNVGADLSMFITEAVVALKETIDDEASEKDDRRILALHLLRLVAICLNRESASAANNSIPSLLATTTMFYDRKHQSIPHSTTSEDTESEDFNKHLCKWMDVFRSDLILETLMELLRGDGPIVANSATLKQLMKVTGRARHHQHASAQSANASTMLLGGTEVARPVRPAAVEYDAALGERIQQTASLVAKEMYEVYVEATHNQVPSPTAPSSSYPLGAAEARRQEMEATLITTPGYSFMDPDAITPELFTYYVNLVNWLCAMEAQGGGLHQPIPYRPLGDDMLYFESMLKDIEQGLVDQMAPPPQPIKQAEPVVHQPTTYPRQTFAITEDEPPAGAVGWGEPETTGTAPIMYDDNAPQYNNNNYEQQYHHDTEGDFSAHLLSAMEKHPVANTPAPPPQDQVYTDTTNQILEMLRSQEAPAAPQHPLAKHPPPLDMSSLVTNHTVGLPVGGVAVTADTATVLVYPIPQVLFDDDDDDSGTNAMNVPLIIVKALGETLGVRVGPATIVGEVARVVVPNHNIAIRAVKVGRFICLGHRCRIIKNERIYDTSDNMRLNGRYFSYNKSTMGFESAHYPLNPNFFYDQQLYKWRREQKQRNGHVPENDEGFVFHPPRSLESRPVHLQRDSSFTGGSFSASSASNMLSNSSRDYGAPAYGTAPSYNQGGGYNQQGGGYNGGSSIGFGDATGGSSW